MIHITIHMDGNTVGCGYKYIVTRGVNAWTAFCTDRGFRRFMKLYGLKINPALTEYKDCRKQGRGRWINCTCFEKKVLDDFYFWQREDVPAEAKPVVDMCNGSYVTCYVLDKGDSVEFYRPNPNAKEVYDPRTTEEHHILRETIG